MEVQGKIKRIGKTETFGTGGFKKRELVLVTEEQYPQMLAIEFTQDKCDLLDKHKVGADVLIKINLRGREWINPEGEAKYFNSIQGWWIEKLVGEKTPSKAPMTKEGLEDFNDPNQDLPF